jgi:hypothetical protein
VKRHVLLVSRDRVDLDVGELLVLYGRTVRANEEQPHEDFEPAGEGESPTVHGPHPIRVDISR